MVQHDHVVAHDRRWKAGIQSGEIAVALPKLTDRLDVFGPKEVSGDTTGR